MKKLNEKISNPIVRGIVFVLLYILVTILVIPAIPYAIIRGMFNLKYYDEWFEFVYNLQKN